MTRGVYQCRRAFKLDGSHSALIHCALSGFRMEMHGYTKHVFECLQDVYPVATPKDCSNERAAIVVGVCVSVCLCRGRFHGTRARKGMAGAAGKPDALLDQLSLVSQVEAPSTCASEPDFVEIRARCHGS